MTFESLAALWLKTRKNKVSWTQYKNLRCYINHLNRYISNMDVAEIKPMDIDALLDALTDENPNTHRPASRQTLVNVRSTASRVFEYGIDIELIVRNPARGREISRYAPRHYRRALTIVEQKLIIATPHRARMGVLVMMLAGLRRGELIPLTWDDIDLDALKISITKSAESKGSNRLFVKEGTKTSWGRVVDIPLDLALELQKAKAVSMSKYVCPRVDGQMHTLMSWRRMWDSYITALCKVPGAEKTNIQEITAHYLRHTYATLLYISGVDVLTASKLLGHANIKTTMSIYTHLDDMLKAKSVDKLDSYLSSSLFTSSGQVRP
ncbi:tyrosine-type recombinase/integrase [Clostridium minihomine]|uniref:tyrosine-type recombinase/integrase n=1 Tax=Clostridium minihomine TaxID=2045012 RepID=UPI000C757374|nr:site-specific integrase [Clostridium minihomine]